MSALTFTAIIRVKGVNPYVFVSAQQATTLKAGWRKPMPVLIKVNGKPSSPWRINMMPVGDGSFYLYLHGDVRKSSATKVGDSVTVELDFDGDYTSDPTNLMPSWFAAQLSQHPEADQNWNGLTPSRQKEVLRYLTNLKSKDARVRNVALAIRALSGSPVRFLGRLWKDGS